MIILKKNPFYNLNKCRNISSKIAIINLLEMRKFKIWQGYPEVNFTPQNSHALRHTPTKSRLKRKIRYSLSQKVDNCALFTSLSCNNISSKSDCWYYIRSLNGKYRPSGL